MGVAFSKKAETPAERRAREQLRHKKQLERYGVLMPPAFGVGRVPLTVSSLDRLSSMSDPSEWEYLHETDTSYRILQDHMMSGLWVSTQSAMGQVVRAALSLPNEDWQSGQGHIYGRQSGSQTVTEVRAGTDTAPSIASRLLVLPGCSVWGNINTTGRGWLGGQIDYTFQDKNGDKEGAVNYRYGPFVEEGSSNDVHVKAGTWLPCDVGALITKSKLSDLQNSVKNLYGYLSVDVLGATMAMEGKLPLATLKPQVSSYFTIDLSGDGPPLELTLEQTPASTTIVSLSQVLTFDRIQLNPMEDRAPSVRNTAGWTIRMEKQVNTGETDVQVGAAWQVNRGMALKAVIRPTQQDCLTAVLLKRWEQPRVTCSILHRHDWKSGRSSFLGFGIELETAGRTLLDTDHAQTASYPDAIGPTVNTATTPPTLVALPTDVLPPAPPAQY
jgi:hypothetical protein